MTRKRFGIVVWSSAWTAANGQSIVTRQVVEGQDHIRWIRAVYSGTRSRSAPSVVRAVVILWAALFGRRAQAIYVVCSRSDAGFLRDIPALAPALLGVRVITHSHGSDIVDLLSNRLVSPIARLLYSNCELIVPSVHLCCALEQFNFKQLHICENFFFPVCADMSSPSQSCESGLGVLWNSNILSSKGFFDVAAAISIARDRGYDLRLEAIGIPLGDAERTKSETIAELDRLRQKSWFTYVGRTTLEEAVIRTASADVIVLPSRYKSECQPLALIQAMCLGKQIIAADTPALRATLKDYPAVLLLDPTPESIAVVLADLLREKAANNEQTDTLLRKAAARAGKRFAVERFNAQMAHLLTQRREGS